ncbi:MAG TPA: class I SAM-dependent methyltransferase [Nitrospirota bacterium]|nr:class I SAM-dependent methyltransferase [Nitrospirota bacterium]
MKEIFRPALDLSFLTNLFDTFISCVIPESKIKGDLIDSMNISDDEKLLDFGCGTGTLLILGKQKHPNAHFEGIDIDPRILAIAKRKIEMQKLDISLIEYDGGELPQKANSVNKVMTSLMMHHLTTDKKLKAIKEIFRILVKGGKLYIADFGKQKNPMFILIGNIAAKFQEEVDANFKGLLPALMTTAGFYNVQTIKTYNTKIGTIYIYAGEKV